MATRYWVGGAGNWSSTAKWSTTSGGASGASVPISTDDVVFDANSSLVGAIATVDTAQTCATLTLTPGAAVGFSTIAITASLTVTGLFSMSGTAGNQRFQIRGTTYGIATNFIVGSASGLSDLDFRDLFITGAATPLSGTRIGNLRGVTGVTFSPTKTVYWNLAGAQNWSANGWAATSGGSPATTNFPLSQDTAVFDNTGSVTGTITMDTAIPYTGTVDMSARSSAMTLATTAFTIYGNWKNGSGTTLSGTAALTFSGRNTQSITSASKTFTQPITIDTYGGTVQLVDALNIGTNTLTVTNGTFTTNGQSVTALGLSAAGTNIRAINLGASTLTLSGTSALQMTNTTNLTFNAGSSNIIFTTSTSATMACGGLTYSSVSFTGTTAATYAITGANTFANLTFTAPAAAGLMGCTFSANQTITGTLTCAGATAVRRIFLRSDTVGTQRTLTCAAISAQDCDFRDIAIAGAAAPYNAGSLRVGDCGGNSGITFPAGVPKYWNLAGAQNWSATGWATSSGGTPAINNFPLAQDTAVFDNTGSVTGTITIDAAWNIGTFNASARTSAMDLTTSTNTPNVYGNWLFGTGVALSSGAGTITFGGRGTQTITSNGIVFNTPITVNSFSGTVQIADAFAVANNRLLTLTSGTFDAVNYNVIAAGFTFTAGTLKMGSGTWTLSGNLNFGNVWTYTAGTFFKGTANMVLSDTTATGRTFAGGGLSYNKLTIGGATGTSTLTITGNNQFTEIASTKTVAHTIDFGATSQTFGAWTVTGTVGNVVTVTGTATLTIAGARVSGVDYLAMGTTAISTTSPGEFYAGANSTGTGTNAILTAAPAATTRYWVGGNGTWDATTTTNWSATSGGAGGASVPTSADAVVFDSASNATAYTVTLTATQLRCAALSIDGPLSGNITFAGTAPLAVHGNLNFVNSAVTTNTYTGALTFSGSTTGKTIRPNINMFSPVTINGVGCGWTITGGIPLVVSGAFTLTNGSFDTGNYGISCGAFSSNNTNTRSFTLTADTINCSGAWAINATNLTFNAGTSIVQSNATSGTMALGGLTFYTFRFSSTTATTMAITGANTFTNLSFYGKTAAGISTYTFSANQTVTGTLSVLAGTDATMRNFLLSDTLGTTRTLTVGTFAAGSADVDFRDITIAGAAAPISGTRFGDCKGNSGITFPSTKTVYWASTVSGQNWGSSSIWAATSGGGGSAVNFPLAQDIATFDSTHPSSGSTAALNTNYNIGTIDMSARTTNTMILATSTTTPTIYGNWINGSGCSFTGTGAITFAGRGSQTITSASAAAFTQQFTINTPDGSVALQDAFANSSTALTIVSGTFNANGFNVTLTNSSSGVATSGTGVRTIAFGSGSSVWTIVGVTAWSASTSTNLTVTGSGTIKCTSASTKTFSGGNVAYTNITLDQGGAGTLTISGNNTLKNITNSSGVANTINFAATTTTLSQFTGAGTSGNLLTLSGTSAAAPATLIYSGGTNVNSNYLTINNVKAYATTSTWYAGANSTNGGTLGWIFTAAPSAAYTRSFGWIIT